MWGKGRLSASGIEYLVIKGKLKEVKVGISGKRGNPF